jgi:hypothetical protein
MRAGVWVVAGLAGAVLVAAGAEARRVVKVSPECPPEAAEMAIDYEGIKDQCVAREPATCKPGRTLAVDRRGKEDSCVSDDGAIEKPACPRGRQWKPRAEADECVATASPVCPRDFRLEERPGEDACRY